jgi:hypothetical protein
VAQLEVDMVSVVVHVPTGSRVVNISKIEITNLPTIGNYNHVAQDSFLPCLVSEIQIPLPVQKPSILN